MSNLRPKKCSHCAEPCTVHVSHVVDGKLCKIDLCENCPLAEQVSEGSSFDLLGQLGESTPKLTLVPSDGVICRYCGFTDEGFKTRGRLGCSHCYEAFEARLDSVFRNTQPRPIHSGKAPSRFASAHSEQQLDALKIQLVELVSREEFEEAAKVRDRIKSLESQD